VLETSQAVRGGWRRDSSRRKWGESVGSHSRLPGTLSRTSAGPRTRLRFLTEGVPDAAASYRTRLSNESPPWCSTSSTSAHLEGDLSRSHSYGRPASGASGPDLRLVVMSGDAGRSAPFGGSISGTRRSCDRKVVSTRLAIEYTPHSPSPVEQQVPAALERLAAQGLDGPRAGLPSGRPPRSAGQQYRMRSIRSEKRMAPASALWRTNLPRSRTARWRHPTPSEDHPFRPNVAESSVTIEGVSAVIDSGLARGGRTLLVVGSANARSGAYQPGVGQSAGGAGGANGFRGAPFGFYPLEDFVRPACSQHTGGGRVQTLLPWRFCCTPWVRDGSTSAGVARPTIGGGRRSGRGAFLDLLGGARCDGAARNGRAIRCIPDWAG